MSENTWGYPIQQNSPAAADAASTADIEDAASLDDATDTITDDLDDDLDDGELDEPDADADSNGPSGGDGGRRRPSSGGLSRATIARVIRAYQAAATLDDATLQGVAGLLGVDPDPEKVVAAKLTGAAIPRKVFGKVDDFLGETDKGEAMFNAFSFLTGDDSTIQAVWRIIGLVNPKLPAKRDHAVAKAARDLVNATFKLPAKDKEQLASWRDALESI